jgi:hypothetical protein
MNIIGIRASVSVPRNGSMKIACGPPALGVIKIPVPSPLKDFCWNPCPSVDHVQIDHSQTVQDFPWSRPS